MRNDSLSSWGSSGLGFKWLDYVVFEFNEFSSLDAKHKPERENKTFTAMTWHVLYCT